MTELLSHKGPEFFSHLRRWRACAAAFAAGAATTLALPPVDFFPVLFLTFPVLLWLIAGAKGWRGGFWRGWWFGFGYFTNSLYWLAFPLLIDAANYAWLIPFATLGLPAMLALFVALPAAGAQRYGRTPFSRLLFFAVAFSLFEWLRGHILTGFPWMLIGYGWSGSLAISQSLSIIGIYGLGFLTVIVAGAPALLAGKDLRTLHGWRPAITAGAAVLALFAAGGIRLALHDSVGVHPDIRLRLVQANIPQKEKWEYEKRPLHFDDYMELSRAGNTEAITHVIWPETAVPYFLNRTPARRVLIGSLVPETGAVLTGGVRLLRPPGEDYTAWNSVFVIDHFGDIAARYDKVHLVPFGEYVPLGDWLEQFGFSRVTPGLADFEPGDSLMRIEAAGLPPFTPLVCYEVIFPGAVVPRAGRPQWLLNVTNDAWYGETVEPYQHLAMTRARSIEEGLPVVRAAGTGISAVIDPLGRITGRIDLGRRAALDAGLPLPLAPTLYARMGDGLYFILLFAAVAVLYQRRYRRRGAGSASGS